MAVGTSIKDIRQLTQKQVARAIRPAALRRIRAAFERIKRETLSDFNSHPITMEIEAGPLAANISGTLSGKGNLFSFIGFEKGSRPVEVIRRLIIKSYVSAGAPVGRYLYFNFFLPDMEEIYANTQMPWATGRSWARGIETGMSGLGQYAYSRQGIGKSRSGTAIQTQNVISGADYTPTRYMTKIIGTATAKLERIIV
jgi:hypothetical protein|tara:strand:- start:5310 stop:5903 length:594 start_codon:yes stop_codon:yes gene_type:complete